MSAQADRSSSETKRRRGDASPRRGLWAGASIGVLGVTALFVGQSALESYLRGETFRHKTEAALGRILHAEAALEPLERQGIALSSERLELNGTSGAFFSKALLHGVWAELDLGGIWKRLWKVEMIRFQRIEVNLDPPSDSFTAPSNEAHSQPLAVSPWWARFLPNRTEVAAIQTDRATLKRSGFELKETRLNAKPQDGGWDISLESGELRSPHLPAMEVSKARVSMQGKNGSLRSARLLVKTGGQVQATGEWGAETGIDLHGKLENVDVRPFLPEWWQARLRGSLIGDIRFLRNSTQPEGQLTGELKLQNGTLEGLPLLSQLGTFIGNPRFRQVPLKNASARLTHTATRTTLKDLDLDADGVLRIRGDLSVEKGALKGSLKLGISASLIQWLPGVRSKVFDESADGYVWTPVQVSGSLEEPIEDLSPRLISEAVGAVSETVRDLPKKLPVTPSPIPEAAKGLMDAVKSLIPAK